MRYFFHLKSSDETMLDDSEGTELPSLAAAREHAVECAREIISWAVKQGRPYSPDTIILADSAGKAVLEVPFAAALPPQLREI